MKKTKIVDSELLGLNKGSASFDVHFQFSQVAEIEIIFTVPHEIVTIKFGTP